MAVLQTPSAHLSPPLSSLPVSRVVSPCHWLRPSARRATLSMPFSCTTKSLLSCQPFAPVVPFSRFSRALQSLQSCYPCHWLMRIVRNEHPHRTVRTSVSSETRVRIGRRAWLSSALLSMGAFLLQFVCKYPIFCAIDDNFCNYSDTPYFRTPVKEFLPFFFIFQEIPVIAHFPEIIIIVHLLIISHSSNFPFMIVIFY